MNFGGFVSISCRMEDMAEIQSGVSGVLSRDLGKVFSSKCYGIPWMARAVLARTSFT